MKYTFSYRTTAIDLWQLSMYGIYGSMVGVCNIIFTVAMVLLSVRFWGDVDSFIKMLFIGAISLFVVIQPMVVYIRAKRQVGIAPQDIEIGFDDSGIHIKTDKQGSDIEWNAIKGASKKPTMIVIFTKTKHGFVLTNKVLGKHKEALYEYILLKTQK